MVNSFRRLPRLAICLTSLMLVSCLTMTVPKTAQLETGGPPADKRLVDTWELIDQVSDKGDKELPKEGTRTLIEFTDKGRVIFNRTDKENSGAVKNRTGKFTQENSEIVLTDADGNTARWTYTINGDTLTITAPEMKMTYHWRRFR